MVKYLLPLLLVLSGCGSSGSVTCLDGLQLIDGFCAKVVEVPGPTQTLPPEPSILNKWVETAASPVLQSPDFTSMALNTTGSGDATLGCTGSYGNNIVVNTMTSGQARIQGNSTDGFIQFGNTKYVGMDFTTIAGLNCKNASKEMYRYTIRSQILTLCLTNLSYPYCSTYIVL